MTRSRIPSGIMSYTLLGSLASSLALLSRRTPRSVALLGLGCSAYTVWLWFEPETEEDDA
jgi:hypothetical protein